MPGIIAKEEPIEIAIVGGGIVGVVLAAGLVHRNIRFKLYEQARNFSEIGAGIGFTANTVRCMEQINPAVVTALRGGGAVNPSLDEHDPNAYFRYLDGCTQHDPNDATYQRPLFKLDAGPQGWETVRRDLFLMELVKKIPQEAVQLRTRLDHVQEGEIDEKILLRFVDGTTATADAVIACDGLKSRTRETLLGRDHPASFPQFTHKVAYRTLIPADKAIEALGEYKARRLHFHLGPKAHLLHYPVNEKMIGAAVYVADPNEWPRDQPLTAWGLRKDVEKALAGWCAPVSKLVALFPEQLEQWALFDMFEYPLETYNYGRIALAGDAAHASSPHHGAGASFGIEDALCLCTLLSEVTSGVREHEVPKGVALKTALATYDAVRRRRTQWLVNSSRRTCDLYQQPEWADPVKHVKAETCFEEVQDRSFKIWHFNSAAMVDETVRDYRRRLPTPQPLPTTRPGNGTAPPTPQPLPTTRPENSTLPPTPKSLPATKSANGTSSPTTKLQYDWLVQLSDKPGMLQTRLANLQTHLDNLHRQVAAGKITMGGPTLSLPEKTGDDSTEKPKILGSVQMLKAGSEDEVWQLLKADPYAKLGVWDLDQATVTPMKVGIMTPI